MEPIDDQIARQLNQAVEQWKLLWQRTQREVDNAELSDVGSTLAAAIHSVPIDCPPQLGDQLVSANPNLRKHVKHLALVADALRGFRHGGTVSYDGMPLHWQGRLGRGLFSVDI